MSSAAQVIPLYPEKPRKAPVRPYTKLDEEQDMAVLYDLPNALVKPALFLLSRRGLRVSGASWAEVAAKIKRSQPQTSEALNRLAELGCAESRNGLWYWVSVGNPQEILRKSYMAAPKNTVPDSAEQPSEYKELTELKEGRKEGPNTPPIQPTIHSAERLTPPAPDGAAPDGAENSTLSLTDSEPGHSKGENVNAQEKQEVPPAAPAYRMCMHAITAAGLTDAWRDWVRLTRIGSVGQEKHAPLWYGWIQEGLTENLRESVTFLSERTYTDPLKALKKFMGQAAVKETIIPTNTAELPFKVGDRVLYPDGVEAEVLAVRTAGISTDHPEFPDVPVSGLKALKVLP